MKAENLATNIESGIVGPWRKEYSRWSSHWYIECGNRDWMILYWDPTYHRRLPEKDRDS